jgi:hypothetical protein
VTTIHINDTLRADIRKRDWAAVHLAGDRNPPLRLWPRLGRYAGEGLRRERGGER